MNNNPNMIIDITKQFKNLVPQEFLNQSQITKIVQSIQSQLCTKQAQDITSSIKKIQQILQSNKQNYFSNAAYSYSAFTDQQRNEFDNQMRKLVDSVNYKIAEIRQVVEGVKFRNTTEKEHLKNMVICLYQLFKNVSNQFKEFIEFNQNRKKKLQNMLGNQIKKQFKTIYNQGKEKQQKKVRVKQEQSSPINQQLQKQAKLLFMQKMSEQKKIEQTMKKLTQISTILDVMQNKVLQQQLLTSSFRQIGQVGLFHIEKGNKNLVQANNLSKDSGRLWTMFFLMLALSLLTLDYLKS